MTKETLPITVTILDREYRVTCPVGEEQALLKSARQLDERMLEIKQSGKVVGTDRVAVMAALNLINELSSLQTNSSSYSAISHKLENLHSKIDNQMDLFK